MDPLGTITSYFPFIDKETRDILIEIMDDADDYFHFVQNLYHRVIETDCSDLVVYFSIFHSALLFDLKKINSIGEKYGERQILLPNLYFASAFQGKAEDLEKVHESAEAILATNPDDWLTLEMRCMKFEADMRLYPKTMYDVDNFDAMMSFIEKNPHFSYYHVTLYHYLSIRANVDGNSEERARYVDMAIEAAREYDDQLRLAYLLLTKADVTEAEDRMKSMEIMKEAIDIFDYLGTKAGFASALEKLGRFEATRGEYNLAIEHYEEAVAIRESLNIFTGLVSLLLSTFYNVIGEYESGLDWGRMAEEQFENRPILKPRAVLHQAWSLILLSKLTEAQVLLDTIQETVHKSGHETILAWLHFVTGILERENGDYTSAASSIEEALKIYYDRGTDEYIVVIFLKHLAEIEMLSSDMSTAVYPSLALLEEKAGSEDLPGIMGQALLLKAEIALRRDDDATLRDIIQELNPLAESPSTRFLSPHYDRLMKKI